MDAFDILTISLKVVFISWVVITIFMWATGDKPLETIVKAQINYIIEEAESVQIFENNK